MTVPFIDLEAQHRSIDGEVRARMEEVYRSGLYILGPAVGSFEKAMAEHHGVSHGIGVASGTDALVLALIAAGVGPGDEVITTPFTYVATAESIVHAGAKPCFVDIDERTFNFDPALVEAAVTESTRAILPVHLYGLPADMIVLGRLACSRGLKIIEDCAQSTGARVGDRFSGSLGDAGAFSFFPTKNLGGFGDGGMILTDDDTLAGEVRKLRSHGSVVRDRYEMLGFNSRLDTLQATVLELKLKSLDGWNAMRRRSAALYGELLGGIEEITLPLVPEGLTHVYNQYTIMTGQRDQLKEHLRERGIGSMVYYSEALHVQPLFSGLGYRPGDFPVAERACRSVLSLPVYPGISEAQVAEVAGAVRDFFTR